MRTVGPWLSEHRVGRANLAAAFPEQVAGRDRNDPARRLGQSRPRRRRDRPSRPHLLGDPYRRNYVAYPQGQIDRFVRLKNSGRPALIFSAHLANRELPAVISSSEGINSVILYRLPNLRAVADAVIALRGSLMGELVPSSLRGAGSARPGAGKRALCRHAGRSALRQGRRRHFLRRRCLANPLIAMLARRSNARFTARG